MDYRNIIIAIAALIIFLGVAYLVYDYGLSISDHDAEDDPKEIYFGFLASDPGGSYSKVYLSDNDGFESTFTIVKNENGKYFESETIAYTQKIYYLENETIVCVSHLDEEGCSLVTNSSELQSFAESKKIYFPSTELFQSEKEFSEFLIEREAMVFSNHTEELNVSGVPCKLIEYSIDFSQLSLDDLAEVGIDSVQALAISDYNFKLCIGEQGDKVFENFTYSIYGLDSYVTTTLVEKSDEGDFVVPQDLINESQVEALFKETVYAKEHIYECIYDEDPSGCFKQKGVYSGNVYYCYLSESNKDPCLTIVASKTLDSSICDLVDSSSFRDDCYLDMAVKLGNSTFCGSITNITLNADCLNLTAIPQ